jgi:hypothetical protein
MKKFKREVCSPTLINHTSINTDFALLALLIDPHLLLIVEAAIIV